MNILYFHMYFNTPEEGGSIRSYNICKKLIQEGHNVKVITTSNNLNIEKRIHDIHIKYYRIKYSQNMSYFRRSISFLIFFFYSLLSIFKEKYDLIYATSTPLSVGIPALLAKKLLNKNYIFEARDLWPYLPIKIGIIKNQILISILYFIEKLIYTNAKKVIILSKSALEVVKVNYPNIQFDLIPNFSDNVFFKSANETDFSKPKYNFIYMGSIGYANNIDAYLNLANDMKHETNYRFYIVGDGSYLKYALDKIKNDNLFNVVYNGKLNKYDLLNLLKSMHFVYISFNQDIAFETTSPNKFFDGLAAGKIIISNISGWIKDIIEINDCGIHHDINNNSDFIKKLKNRKLRYQIMANNAFKLSSQFSIENYNFI